MCKPNFMKKNEILLPAVVYARYSSHNQTEQSIEGQLHDAYAFAEREGYKIVREYIDRAQSGTTDSRTAFQRMIADAPKHQFEYIIVWKLDRFARNRYDSAIYKAKLKKDNVRVISVMERIEDNPEGIILEGMLESMAEYYSANLSVNIKRGLRESRSKGKLTHRAIYGYVPDGNGGVVIDDKQAAVVKEVFRRYADGEFLSYIIKDLNKKGHRTPSGNLLSKATFSKLIRNPAYIGEYAYDGEITGLYPPIVDREIFERAGRRCETNKTCTQTERVKVKYILQGRIFCGYCGYSMCGEYGKNAKGFVYYYYKCRGRKSHATNCRKAVENKFELENYVIEETQRYILAPGQKEKVADAIISEFEKEQDCTEMRQIESQIAKIDSQISTLIETLSEAPKAIRGQIYAKLEAFQNQRDDLDAKLTDLKITSSVTVTREEIVSWLDDTCKFDADDPDCHARLVDLLVNAIYVYDDKIMIFWNIGASSGKPVQIKKELPESESSNDGDESGTCAPTVEQFIFIDNTIGVQLPRFKA